MSAFFRRLPPLGRAGLALALGLGLSAVVGPALWGVDPDQVDAGPKLLSPCLEHPFGTDDFGRDLLARTLVGARISLGIGVLAAGLASTLGTTVGVVAGTLGGAVDRALMWVVDLLSSLPRLVLLLALVGFFRVQGATALGLIVTILGLTGWMGVSRIVRSTVLSLREQDFVVAARAMGLPQWRIILHHILPNALAPVIVHSSLGVGSAILTEATLSFLGLGVPPPTATWGAIVNDGRELMRSAPWVSIIPGLATVSAVMAFNLLGDGLRDALDPRQGGRS